MANQSQNFNLYLSPDFAFILFENKCTYKVQRHQCPNAGIGQHFNNNNSFIYGNILYKIH